MAWRKNDEGYFEPDGTPFDPPADRFEEVYNHRLKLDPVQTTNDIYDPWHGYPLSMRNYRSRPASAAVLQAMLDHFFDPRYQKRCLQAGNLPAELDELATRLLDCVAELGVPVRDRERKAAKRLGMDLGG